MMSPFALICFIFQVWRINAITVSSASRREDASCCNSSVTACKSLSYAFSCISNGTAGSPTDVQLDGDVIIDGITELIMPYGYNITISSKASTPAVLRCTSAYSMLIFKSIGGASVSLRNIIVRNCGPNVPSAVLIEGPLTATFDNCTFMDNLCSGLNSRDANLTVNNSRFINNIANQSNSFDIDFAYGNTSLGGGLGIMFDKAIGNRVEILSSDFMLGRTFVNTDPNAASHDTSKRRLLSNYYASGGGLSVINTFDSRGNTALIKNCKFEQNRGTYGGGLFLTFVHNSTASNIIVENCTVAHNYVSLTGGGLLISSWDRAHNNSITLNKCNIYSNNAMGGGAMKVIYNSIDPFNENRGGIVDFQMHGCNVFENKAMSGSALRLLSNLPFGRIPPLVPKLYNCTLKGHSPARGSKEYPGAVLSTKLGIEFHGNNFLVNNTLGSAIHISSGIIHVRGTLVFQGNIGLQGGAVYVAESSRIVLYPESHMKVLQNHANFRGGGFYVEATTLREVTYPYNPGCFLQYSEENTPPSKWKVATNCGILLINLKNKIMFAFCG